MEFFLIVAALGSALWLGCWIGLVFVPMCLGDAAFAARSAHVLTLGLVGDDED